MMTAPYRMLALVLGVLALSSCSTVSRVGDTLWPFGGGGEESDGIDRTGRISLGTADERLKPSADKIGTAIILPESRATSSWPQAGGGSAKNTGHLSAAIDFTIVGRVQAATGTSNSVRLVAPPVAADGRLFVMGADQTISAYDINSLTRLWRVALPAPDKRDRLAQGGGIAIQGQRLIATSGFGYVAAMSAETGAIEWQRETESPMVGAPTILSGRVFASSNNSTLYALDLRTGDILWTDQAIAESARVMASSSPAAAGELLVAPFPSGELIAYLPVNGRRLWQDALSRSGRFTTPLSAINDIAGRPVIAEGVIYAGSQSGILAAIDARTGQRGWAVRFPTITTPVVVGSYLIATSIDGQIAAFDRLTGDVIWAADVQRFKNEEKRRERIIYTSPLVISGKMYVATSMGQLLRFSVQTGAVEAELDLGDPVFIDPILVGDRMYILTDTGRLIVVE
jgi:outer membrane protein assembly factor BamB